MKAGSKTLILARIEADARSVLGSVLGLLGWREAGGVALLRSLTPRDVAVLALGGYRLVVYADEKLLRLCRDADCAWRGVMLVYEG